ncbi:hypothetical protein ACP4OV_013801 [Aristida adscensionis]
MAALRALRALLPRRHLVTGLPATLRDKTPSYSPPVQPGSVPIRVRRNFNSGPPISENVPKMESGSKGSRAQGTEKSSSGAEGQSDESRIPGEVFEELQVYTCWLSWGCVVMSLYNIKQAYSTYKSLLDYFDVTDDRFKAIDERALDMELRIIAIEHRLDRL